LIPICIRVFCLLQSPYVHKDLRVCSHTNGLVQRVTEGRLLNTSEPAPRMHMGSSRMRTGRQTKKFTYWDSLYACRSCAHTLINFYSSIPIKVINTASGKTMKADEPCMHTEVVRIRWLTSTAPFQLKSSIQPQEKLWGLMKLQFKLQNH
jgi:hypothetical protein